MKQIRLFTPRRTRWVGVHDFASDAEKGTAKATTFCLMIPIKAVDAISDAAYEHA
jgi:hypothetical protein